MHTPTGQQIQQLRIHYMTIKISNNIITEKSKELKVYDILNPCQWLLPLILHAVAINIWKQSSTLWWSALQPETAAVGVTVTVYRLAQKCTYF